MINRISNRLRRRSRKVQETLGITGAKGNVLDYILVESEKHNVYQKEIEKEFDLRPSTATEVLKHLEEEETDCPCTGRRGRTAEKNCLYGKSKGDPKCPPVGNQAVGRSSAAWHFQRRAGCIYEDYG